MLIWSLGWKDPLEESMAIHSSILAWRIPWTKEFGVLQSIGSHRVGHIWSDTCMGLLMTIFSIMGDIHSHSHLPHMYVCVLQLLRDINVMAQQYSIAFLKKFLLEGNCFTILCWFLPYINMNQPKVYICPLPLEPPSHFQPLPSALGCYRGLVWAPWVIQQIPIGIPFYFTYGNVYVWDPSNENAPPTKQFLSLLPHYV